MSDKPRFKQDDSVVILNGPFKGRIAIVISNYPYPEGDSIYIVEVYTYHSDSGNSGTVKIKVGIDEIMQIYPECLDVPKLAHKTEPDYLVRAIFKEGQRVIITSKEYRGSIGTITNVKTHAGGCLFDYEVALENQSVDSHGISVICREEDIVPTDYNRMMYNGIDIGKFLSNDWMTEIAQDQFSEAIASVCNQIIANRSIAGISILDSVLSRASQQYINNMDGKIKESFIDAIKNFIASDLTPTNEKFMETMRYQLNNAVEQYLKDHPEEFTKIIHDNMKNVASTLTAESISKLIAKNLDISSIIKEAFTSK